MKDTHSDSDALIDIRCCRICNQHSVLVPELTWRMKPGEAWLVTGANGSGKAAFVHALAGQLLIDPLPKGEVPASDESFYHSVFAGRTAVVSLEAAAALIAEERARDESEILDCEDAGRTVRQYVCEVLGGSSKKNAPLPPIASSLEKFPAVKLCGLEPILDRGLRYLSTGEIRRTLLCRALLSNCTLLILSDPFAGLDADSRCILLEFFDTMLKRQKNAGMDDFTFPRVVLSMERFFEIPAGINKVLEFSFKRISFCGDRADYERMCETRRAERQKNYEQEKTEFLAALQKIRSESHALTQALNDSAVPDTLIEFKDVNVGWGDHAVLVHLNWKVKKNTHWLIRGPNGSGKTTILELITGDNMQVFREQIFLFGKRRGSGETIWDIKKQLGIVSYRLHVEYRMVGGTDLQSVIVSGFKDSIGLYEMPTDFEKATALQWLKLAGFAGRENESFGSLSYGEQRAILIVRAAVKNPRVLILDEPCHGLDETYRQKILDLIETIAGTGLTTLLHVTHDPSEVLECEQHILELHPNERPMYRILSQVC